MSNVKNKKNQLRAVIYARYSDDNQRVESIEGQIRECTEFANEEGYTIVNTYTDKARTGKNDKRPGFQKMYLDSKKDIFDVVIVWKIDRFARKKDMIAHYRYQFEQNGVKVISAKEPVPEGVLFCRAFRKGKPWNDGKCVKAKMERRSCSFWISCKRRTAVRGRSYKSSTCKRHLSNVL